MFTQILWRLWDFVAVEFSYYSWGSVYVHQDFTESMEKCCTGIFLLFIEHSFLLGPLNLPLTYRGPAAIKSYATSVQD